MKEIPEILFEPGRFFEDYGEQDISLLFKFWMTMSLIPAIEFTAIILITQIPIISFLEIESILFIPLIFIVGYLSVALGGLFINFIFSVIIHFFAYLFHCRGFKKTLTSVMISGTPNLLIGFCVQLLLALGSFFFLTAWSSYLIFVTLMLVLMGTMWVWSLIINIIGLSKLHETSITKALLSAFIIPLIIFGSISTLVYSYTQEYISEFLVSRTSTISVDAFCSDGEITIAVKNKGTKDLEDKDIRIKIDGLDESIYFDFEKIPPGEIVRVSDNKLTKYEPGKHTIEVNRVSGVIVEC